jgi:phosphatidylserine/phosphatidylglycerophosphate/cardiolipin synthase-like enzyme
MKKNNERFFHATCVLCIIVAAAIMSGCNKPEVEVYFCPRDNCSEILIKYMNSTNNVYCAFYDYRLGYFPKNARFVFDDHYANTSMLNRLNVTYVTDKSSRLMHNKFCIIEDTVLTGSYNPTPLGTYFNNNNLVIIHDSSIAGLFMDEFFEMFNGTFSGGKKTKPQYGSVRVYFCPEDSCEMRLLDVLSKAEDNIKFMTFSFTSKKVAEKLIDKSNAGVSVIGVYERRQSGGYSTFSNLRDNRIAVYLDGNKRSMHHKVFIIDNRTVVTGSYNPTGNGNKYNDENMLIINDEEIAGQYLEEFELVLHKSLYNSS